MSTYVHTPSHSPSGSDFFAFRHRPQNMHDSHFVAGHSPCRQFSATPPRKQPYLLLTPSPLRRRTDCNLDFDSAMQLDFDDFSSAAGFSTPFHSKPNRVSSPKNRHRPRPLLDQPMSKRNQNILPEDDEGLFLRSSTGHTSLPLWSPDRLLFDHVEGPKTISKINFSHAPKRKVIRDYSTTCYFTFRLITFIMHSYIDQPRVLFTKLQTWTYTHTYSSS